MQVKVSEATGPVLDWMVAKAQNLTIETKGRTVLAWLKDALGEDDYLVVGYRPSTSWAQGGLIIDREDCIAAAERLNDGTFRVQMPYDRKADKPGRLFYGPTPLIAAMRCYVASKLGDEVKVPDELV